MRHHEYCLRCDEPLFGGDTQKYCPECRRLVKQEYNRGKGYAIIEYYQFIGGPAEVSDLVEIGGQFSCTEILQGIRDRWIPDGSILRKGREYFIIHECKKKRMIRPPEGI